MRKSRAAFRSTRSCCLCLFNSFCGPGESQQLFIQRVWWSQFILNGGFPPKISTVLSFLTVSRSMKSNLMKPWQRLSLSFFLKLCSSTTPPTVAKLKMTPSATMSRCGFRLGAHIQTGSSRPPAPSPPTPQTQTYYYLPTINCSGGLGETLLSVSLTVASQMSLGEHYAGGQQINGFHHRSISTLCVWSVYWTTPPLCLLLETIDALLQWN